MDYQKNLKLFKRGAARLGMRFAVWLVEHLPFLIVRGFISGCLFLTFKITLRHRAVARESLRLAFGQEKSPEELEKIADECFDHIRASCVELLYFSRYPERCLDYFSIVGREHLDRALAQGRGVVAVSAHFGNFSLMMLAFARYGYKVSIILRRARDEKVADFILATMDRCGVKTIYSQPRRSCVQETLKALRNNEIVFILLDQHFGSEGAVLVEFFGRKAATATGPVIFADRSKAPLLPIFNLRDKNGQHRILIEPPMELEGRPTHEEMIEHNVSRLTAVIESYIRRYPAQWGWMHRRWKIREQADAVSPLAGTRQVGRDSGDGK